ncbi:hypothetical protein ACPEIF_03445 [Streptomyces sp. NPDC012600]|uniref:Uncharacterized protein n=1 Tax=Streptomyces stephensoniae TaxID=3375367 RepID=A0ABU2VY26_9ACTN|nr:hypothetical protein [Streptomyces griseus]MDT0490487.1 hypothetical protein [Streptomyces griseus]
MSDNFPPPPPEQPQPAPHTPAQAGPEPERSSPQPPPSPWAREPWAAPAPAGPARKGRTGLIVTLVLGVSFALVGAVVVLVYSLMQSAWDSAALSPERPGSSSSTPYTEEDEEEPDEEPEFDTDGTADVTITKCTRDSLIDWPHAELEVVNGTGSTAAYVAYVSFVDRDGELVSEGLAVAEDVAPGEKAKMTAQGTGEAPEGTKCRLDRVQRDAM